MTIDAPARKWGGSWKLAGVLALAAAGCGGGAAGPTAEVSGTVNIDGQPLAGADVEFIPVSDAGLGIHVARTDASGAYTLKPDGSNMPFRPGSYVVTVRKLVTGGSDSGKPGGGMGAVTNEVPAAYGNRTKSQLRAEVKAGSQTLPAFELKKSVRG
ncbi:MAG TPA: carboxypeptidase-like regulatory domain-containing protein [Urbifossiella sp.]|jgi:hypothetical protein|nr:carboxypeptidase-like regulatory domain-containing protein [Urbifossiella sp.]